MTTHGVRSPQGATAGGSGRIRGQQWSAEASSRRRTQRTAFCAPLFPRCGVQAIEDPDVSAVLPRGHMSAEEIRQPAGGYQAGHRGMRRGGEARGGGWPRRRANLRPSSDRSASRRQMMLSARSTDMLSRGNVLSLAMGAAASTAVALLPTSSDERWDDEKRATNRDHRTNKQGSPQRRMVHGIDRGITRNCRRAEKAAGRPTGGSEQKAVSHRTVLARAPPAKRSIPSRPAVSVFGGSESANEGSGGATARPPSSYQIREKRGGGGSPSFVRGEGRRTKEEGIP